MNSIIIQLFKDLIDRIPDIEEPEAVWDELKDLQSEFNYSERNMSLYKKQVLYNILHNAAWPDAKKEVESFLSKTALLTTEDIVEYKLESHIKSCNIALKGYINMLSERINNAELLVEKLFALNPQNIVYIQVGIMGLASEVIRDMNGALTSEELSAALQATLVSKGLQSNDIIAATQKCILETRDKEGASNPFELTEKIVEIENNSQKISNNLHHEVLKVENLLKSIWNRDDIELKYIGREAEKGFRQASEEFDRYLVSIVVVHKRGIFGEASNEIVTKDNAAQLLQVITRAQRKIDKIENGFFVEFILWICVCILLGGVGCLAYYAYELHIKPLRLGIALGLVGISILGLIVRNWYQQKKVRDIMSGRGSGDINHTLTIANPTDLTESEINFEPVSFPN